MIKKNNLQTSEKLPHTVEEVAVKVSIDIELISYTVVQNRVAVLEVVEDTQDGAVVIVRGQRSQTNVLKRDVLSLVCGHQAFDFELQVQHLVVVVGKQDG